MAKPPPGVERPNWKRKSPACLNCTPIGFVPGTGPLRYICGANFDYFFADVIVTPLRAIGIDTPNKITYLNCVVRIYCIYLFYCLHHYPAVAPILVLTQVLDCADGQCARRYGLGSTFGAWLDHTTDMIFGFALAFSGLKLIHESIGVFTVGWWTYLAIMITMGVLGRAAIEAKEAGKSYTNFNVVEVAGMYQELYMSQLYIFLVFAFSSTGCFPV